MTNQANLNPHIEPEAITILSYVAAFVTAVVIGVVAATGEPIPIIMIVGGIVSLFLIFRPLILLWVITFWTLIIAGGISYFFPSLNKLWWAGYILAFILYVPGLLQSLSARDSERKKYPSSHLVGPLLVLIGICVLSTLVNSAPIWPAVLAVKSMFLYGGVWAALSLINFSPNQIKKWLLALLGIGFFQAIPVVYQYLFVRSSRIQAGLGDVTASDSVVGTFGGSMESGGLGAVMGFYAFILIIGLCSFRRFHLISRFNFLWMMGLLIPPLLLTEVKVIFIYLPIGFALLYRDVLKTRPLAFLRGAILVITFGMIMLIGYQAFHWSASDDKSLMYNVTRYFGYSFEEKLGKSAELEGQMTRRQVLDFWWEKNGADKLLPTLIGHGLGASRTAGLSAGYIAMRYAPLQIDKSGLALLLWDVGVLGVLAVLTMLFAAYCRAGALGQSRNLVPWQRAVAVGLQIVFALTVVALGYRSDIPYAAPMMFIVVASLGLVDWLHKQEKQEKEEKQEIGLAN